MLYTACLSVLEKSLLRNGFMIWRMKNGEHCRASVRPDMNGKARSHTIHVRCQSAMHCQHTLDNSSIAKISRIAMIAACLWQLRVVLDNPYAQIRFSEGMV